MPSKKRRHVEPKSIAQTAWDGTSDLNAATPAERFRFMLEFLTCNGVGAEDDDLQAEVIRECRVKVGMDNEKVRRDDEH